MVDTSQIPEFATLAAVFVGTAVAAGIAYLKRPKTEDQNPIVAGIGMEFGSKLQIESAIGELKRIADYLSSISSSMAVLADRKQAELHDQMDDMKALLERMAEKERRN